MFASLQDAGQVNSSAPPNIKSSINVQSVKNPASFIDCFPTFFRGDEVWIRAKRGKEITVIQWPLMFTSLH